MVKRKKMKGGADVPVLTKQEVLADPKIKEALKQFVQSGAGMKMRQKGGSSWWSSFVSWLKDNKVISTASKIGSAIAGAVGFVPLSAALGAVATGSSAYGYGKHTGMSIRRPRMIGGALPSTSIAMPGYSSAIPYLKW